MPSVFLIFTVFSSPQISECCLCTEYVPVSSTDPSLTYFFALIFYALCFSIYLPSTRPSPSLLQLISLSLSLDSFTITFCLRALLCDWCGHLYSVGCTKKMERKVCVHVCVDSGGLMVPNVWPTSTERQTDLQLWGLCVRSLWFSLRTASNLSLYLEQASNWTLSWDLFACCCLQRQEWFIKLNFGSVFLEVNI